MGIIADMKARRAAARRPQMCPTLGHELDGTCQCVHCHEVTHDWGAESPATTPETTETRTTCRRCGAVRVEGCGEHDCLACGGTGVDDEENNRVWVVGFRVDCSACSGTGRATGWYDYIIPA